MSAHRISMSNLFIPMVKDASSQATLPGHNLMIRAGLIRKMESGIYTLLPLALRSLRKIERIVESEMDAISAQRLQLPCLNGADQWKKSGRWYQCGSEIFKFPDRKGSDFCLAPTCEEAITSLVGLEVSSYRSLPLRLYQINLKFRDEIRPRFGMLRCREFVMKDMYSFDVSEEKAIETYNAVSDAYFRIFQRIGVPVHRVLADTGNIGGSLSHEFHIESDHGADDVLIRCQSCGYASNSERAVSRSSETQIPYSETASYIYATEDSIDGIEESRTTFTVIVPRGREPNPFLISSHIGQSCSIVQSNEFDYGMVIVDSDIDIDSVKESLRLDHNNAIHHIPCKAVTVSDSCKSCGSKSLSTTKGIEVGHIFHLGTKYSKTMNATFTDANGESIPFNMGCYGIGISRVMQAVIESTCTTNSSEKGIRWPLSIAPYRACIISNGSPGTDAIAQSLYDTFQHIPLLQDETVLDDRHDVNIGVKFRQADLIGFPYKIIVGRESTRGLVEIESSDRKVLIGIDEVRDYLSHELCRDDGSGNNGVMGVPASSGQRSIPSLVSPPLAL